MIQKKKKEKNHLFNDISLGSPVIIAPIIVGQSLITVFLSVAREQYIYTNIYDTGTVTGYSFRPQKMPSISRSLS